MRRGFFQLQSGRQPRNSNILIQPESNNTQTTNATTLATYEVYAGSFENHVFDHCSDGSMDRIRTVTINENTTLMAFYKAGEAAVVVPEGAEEPGHASYQPSELTVKKGVSP